MLATVIIAKLILTAALIQLSKVALVLLLAIALFVPLVLLILVFVVLVVNVKLAVVVEVNPVLVVVVVLNVLKLGPQMLVSFKGALSTERILNGGIKRV